VSRGTIRHARYYVQGIISAPRYGDIPLDVLPWIDPVAFCLRAIEMGR
jgi:hypothetical protein